MASELHVILHLWLPGFCVNGRAQLVPVFLVGCLEKAYKRNGLFLVTFSFYYKLCMTSVIKSSYQVTHAAFPSGVCIWLCWGEVPPLLYLPCGQGPSCLVSQYVRSLRVNHSSGGGAEGYGASSLG